MGEALYYETRREDFLRNRQVEYGDNLDEYIESLPSFVFGYQSWYSEAMAVVKQVIPDRLEDFKRHYEKPRSRTEITKENYRIEDCLQGIVVNGGLAGILIGTSAAIPHFRQQRAILESAKTRFESTLYDIRHVVQADLMDSELDAAEHLLKFKFVRASGAVAGVVLERHLGQVCADHKIVVAKKNPTISDFNEALKGNGVIEVHQWRFIQHLGDIRNKCDHAKTPEPTSDEVDDLVNGVKKIIKTVF